MGTILGVFGFLKIFWFFWKFSKTRPSMEHWAKFFFEKKLPQNMFKTRLDTFGNDIGHFSIFDNFLIFLKIFEDSTLHGTLGKKFFRENYPKTCSKHVWTLLGTILSIFGILKIFWFFWKFRRIDPPWDTAQKSFSKKLPENMFKTRLDTFGNDFEHFWNIEIFLIFLKFFEDSTLHGTLGKFFFRKNYPKTCSKHVWTLLGTILGIFGFLKIFWFFWKFSKTRPSMEHWANFFFEKKLPQNMFKTRLDTFGNDIGHFSIFENFLIFLKIFEDSTLHGTLGKKFFRENYPKTCSKHVWTLLGTILGIFGILKFFWFFWKFSKTRPSMEYWAKKFSKKLTQNVWTLLGTCSKHVWTLLGTILGVFGFLKIFWFFWKFSKTRPSMEHWAKNFFEKITPKHVQNTFGHFWERYWAFFYFWKFFDFFENFRRLDPPWNTGQKIFPKKLPQIMFKTRLDTFGNDFEQFSNFENFLVFLKISKNRPSMEHCAKNFFEKLPENMFKTRLDTFGNDFEHFWNIENFLFLNFFEDSTLHGTLGKNFFRKNYPKTCSKHVWTLLGTILGIFRFLKIFWFFWKFSKTRPSMEHWAKKFFEKINPKHVQNTFGHFWERFWAFLDFWKFFDFFESFRRLDRPWNTGQKSFRKNYPKTCSKHVWTLLGTILGIFGILKIFWFFLKIFEDSTVHGTLGKIFFREKKLPENMFKTRLDTFGNDFEHFWNIEIFRRLDRPWNTGQKFFFRKKLPENMFKTRLDSFGNDFGHFLESLKFLDFFENFEDSTVHGTLGKNFFRKNYPKTCSKHV